MSRTVELPTPLQLKTFRPVSCPIGHVSLAPWVSSDDNSPYIHPMYQSKPMIDRYPAVLSIPTDWRGGYWDQRQNRVPTEEDVQAVLRSQGEGAVIGGPAFWYPAHWSLRVLAHHSLLCPTVHPANARHIPILQRVTSLTTALADLFTRIQTMVPFLHWEFPRQGALERFGEGRFDGHLLPSFVWQSRITCSSCVAAERQCYHISTPAPTIHGIPLRCAHCILDDKPCLFSVSLAASTTTSAVQSDLPTSNRQEQSFLVEVQARFLPQWSPPPLTGEHLDPETVWFQDMPAPMSEAFHEAVGSDSSSPRLLRVGGLQARGKADTESRKRKSSAIEDTTSKTRRRDESDSHEALDSLRDKWSVRPDDTLKLLLLRQRLVDLQQPHDRSGPGSQSHLPEIHLRIPLAAAGTANQILDDLPAPGSAIIADRAIVSLVASPPESGQPPFLDIALRGTHTSASEVLEAFPDGIASRPAISSKSFDRKTLQRLPQDVRDRWRKAPGSSWASSLSGLADATEGGTGWDDVRREHLALDILGHADTVSDSAIFTEAWSSAQLAIGPYFRVPDVAVTLRIPSPTQLLDSPSKSASVETGHFSPLLLGLSPTTCTPPEFLDWLPSSQTPSPSTLACYVHRLSLGIPSPRPNFDCKVVKSCLDGTDNFSSDEDWIIDGLKPTDQLLMGWMRRVSDDLDCSRVAWSAYLRAASVTVYDVLAEVSTDDGALSDRQAFYTKSVNLLLRRLGQKPVSRVLIEQEVITTTSSAATLPLTAYVLHVLAHDPFSYRHGLDAYSMSDHPSPLPETWPISLGADWLSTLRTAQVAFLKNRAIASQQDVLHPLDNIRPLSELKFRKQNVYDTLRLVIHAQHNLEPAKCLELELCGVMLTILDTTHRQWRA